MMKELPGFERWVFEIVKKHWGLISVLVIGFLLGLLA